MIILNLKNYPESLFAHGQKLLAAVDRALETYPQLRERIVVAPPLINLETLRTSFPRVTLATQHLDVQASYGSTTGWNIPEIAQQLGITYTLLNHSEHRVAADALPLYITKLQDAGIRVIACVERIEEAQAILATKPYAIAYEPKELIGSGISVTTRPQELEMFVHTVQSSTIPLAGAGVSTTEDVKNLLRLGAKGALLASGFVKAQDPYAKLLELCQPYL